MPAALNKAHTRLAWFLLMLSPALLASKSFLQIWIRSELAVSVRLAAIALPGAPLAETLKAYHVAGAALVFPGIWLAGHRPEWRNR